jgi:Cu2+-exporting ATPase
MAIAAALAAGSRHPLSVALVEAADAAGAVELEAVAEIAGLGVESRIGDDLYRLGRADWALREAGAVRGTVLSHNGEMLAAFHFDDQLRPDVKATVASLQADGLKVILVSGDDTAVVARVAADIGVHDAFGDVLPAGKLELIASLRAKGHSVLMVGDGLNDGPAMKRAMVAMAPASATDVSQLTADLVFFGEGLMAVPVAIDAARRTMAVVQQNFALAIGYNLLAVPLAVAGVVTPLIAALAMSGSSLLVVANALRLRRAAR